MPSNSLTTLQAQVWTGSLALEIRLAPADCRTYTDSPAYLVQYPRLSYLAFLLPQLRRFFASSLIDPDVSATEAWVSFDGVPLKWHYQLGLLYDLFSGAEPVGRAGDETLAERDGAGSERLPWQLTVHFSDFPGETLIPLDEEGRTLRDAYVNAVKEADFIRNGTARTVMGMSKEDSDKLWTAVKTHDRVLYNTIHTKLLHPPGVELRHVPLRVYLPTSASDTSKSDTILEESPHVDHGQDPPTAATGHIRVVQALVPVYLPASTSLTSSASSTSRQPQTLGTALHTFLPSLFPSRRNALLAQPVLHGAVVPMSARLDELGEAAGYADGVLGVVVVMMG